MDLINLLPHKKNTTVTVDGTTYKIDGDGICRGVKDPDAAKLLRNIDAWRAHDGKPVTPKSAGVPGGIGLIGVDGAVHHKKGDETKPDLDAPLRAAQDQFEAKKRGEVAEPTEPQWKEPTGDEEWPDPTDEMPVDYLRKMAEAYEVKHTAKTSKRDLIKKIMAEMYPKGKKGKK